jgi:hypothetical protein
MGIRRLHPNIGMLYTDRLMLKPSNNAPELELREGQYPGKKGSNYDDSSSVHTWRNTWWAENT